MGLGVNSNTGSVVLPLRAWQQSVRIDHEVEGESMWVWVLTVKLAVLFYPSVPGSRVSPH